MASAPAPAGVGESTDSDFEDWGEDWAFNDEPEAETRVTAAESEAATRVVETPAVDAWLAPKPAAAEPAAEELGNPEEWDFFDGGKPGAKQRTRPASVPEAAAVAAAPAAPETIAEPGSPGEPDAIGEAPRAEAVDEDAAAAPRFGPAQEDASAEGAGLAPGLDVVVDGDPFVGRSPWVSRITTGVAWSAVAALFAFGLVFGLGPMPGTSAALANSQAVGDLVVDGVESHWIENAHSGSVFVVTGTLRNSGDRDRERMGILSLEFVDATGSAIAESQAIAGLPVPAHELYEGDPADLTEAIERAARQRSKEPFAPGAAWHFQALLTAEPDLAVGYRFVLLPADLRNAERIGEGPVEVGPGPAPDVTEMQGGAGVTRPNALLETPTPSDVESDAGAAAGQSTVEARRP